MSGAAFEAYVFELLKKKYSDYRILVQLQLDSGHRPDFVLEYDSKIIVVDAKARGIIEKRDVDQIASYINELDADFGIIFVADYTEVPESIEDYAILSAIEIEYTDWKNH